MNGRRFFVALGLASAISLAGASPSEGGSPLHPPAATFHDWKAQMRYPKPGLDYHLTVWHAGITVLDRKFMQDRAWPGAWSDVPHMSFVELNADTRAPELLLEGWTGGAHCCAVADIHLFPERRPSIRIRKNFANPGVRLRRFDGRMLFVSGDNRFAYRFTSYADSSWPIQIWEVRGNRFVDVTRSVPALVRRHASQNWRWYREFVRTHRDTRGVLAAWAADELLLGRERYVRQVLPALAGRNGPSYAAGAPQGPTYVRELWRFLESTGYAQQDSTTLLQRIVACVHRMATALFASHQARD